MRRTRLRRVSAKRVREQRERRAVLAREHTPPACWVPGCGRAAEDAHEVLTRARGGSITDPDNLRPLCRAHHDRVGSDQPWAEGLGLLRHSWDA